MGWVESLTIDGQIDGLGRQFNYRWRRQMGWADSLTMDATDRGFERMV